MTGTEFDAVMAMAMGGAMPNTGGMDLMSFEMPDITGMGEKIYAGATAGFKQITRMDLYE
jgi:hypothetical protein